MGFSRKVIFYLLLVMISSLFVSGCSMLERSATTQNPDAEEVLALDPEADFFQFNDIIYQTNIDWVEELSLTKDQEIGEIIARNEKDTKFENGMANKLPVGAKIYSTKEEGDMILIVEAEGKSYKYYALVEG